jgi:ElaB/YqjD/DUF883 family membrane-anchored ribosome-binding protein
MNTTTQNLAKDSHQMVDSGADKAHDMVSKAANKADQAIHATQERAAQAEKSVQDGLKQIGEAVPATLSRAATQAEDMARAGIDRARAAGQSVAQQASHMRDQTVSYVREEPTKALLMAVAAGAFATLLIGWATRGNGNSRH